MDRAAADDRIVVSHDTDFGALLAFRGLTKPSFILFRSSDPITPDEQATLLVSNLDTVKSPRFTLGWRPLCVG